MMNDKIQAILLKIVLELKKIGWVANPDWEVTMKSEGHVPLVKQISVMGSMDDEEWRDDIETHIELKLSSEDQITYWPAYTIYANVFMDGGVSKDVVYKGDADVAFTEKDFKEDRKPKTAAERIDRIIAGHMEQEYADYVDNNAEAIRAYKQGGWKSDQEPDSPPF